MSRAVSVHQLYNQSFKVLAFEGDWLEHIGAPEMTGSWIIWGNSGNGKTRYALKLAKYLCTFGKVAYNSLEEGISMSLKKAFIEEGMEAVKNKLILLDREDIESLSDRLKKRKSPDIVIIDSLQYTGLNYSDYKTLKETHPKKLFIFISHAEGKNPEGRTAKKVRYDANVKIRVEGYRAFAVSRYGGSQNFDIWESEAADYWGEIT